MVNLNPVDTFFDLQNSSLKIGENAIFMIQEDKIDLLFKNKEIKQKLQSKTIYLYNEEPKIAVDLVLMYNDYIPQHSYQQSKLEVEYSHQQCVNDEQYLNKFKEFIDQLNRKYLDTTYINVPTSIEKQRKLYTQEYLGLSGVLHSETPYAILDDKKNLQENISTYEQYIPYIFDKSTSFDMLVANKVIESIKKDVIELGVSPFEQQFSITTHKYENILLKVIEEVTYPEFKQITEKFNEKKLSKINSQRRG